MAESDTAHVEKENAVLLLQSAQRQQSAQQGACVWLRLQEKQRKKDEQVRVKHEAATKIQCAHRTYTAKMELQKRRFGGSSVEDVQRLKRQEMHRRQGLSNDEMGERLTIQTNFQDERLGPAEETEENRKARHLLKCTNLFAEECDRRQEIGTSEESLFQELYQKDVIERDEQRLMEEHRIVAIKIHNQQDDSWRKLINVAENNLVDAQAAQKLRELLEGISKKLEQTVEKETQERKSKEDQEKRNRDMAAWKEKEELDRIYRAFVEKMEQDIESLFNLEIKTRREIEEEEVMAFKICIKSNREGARFIAAEVKKRQLRQQTELKIQEEEQRKDLRYDQRTAHHDIQRQCALEKFSIVQAEEEEKATLLAERLAREEAEREARSKDCQTDFVKANKKVLPPLQHRKQLPIARISSPFAGAARKWQTEEMLSHVKPEKEVSPIELAFQNLSEYEIGYVLTMQTKLHKKIERRSRKLSLASSVRTSSRSTKTANSTFLKNAMRETLGRLFEEEREERGQLVAEENFATSVFRHQFELLANTTHHVLDHQFRPAMLDEDIKHEMELQQYNSDPMWQMITEYEQQWLAAYHTTIRVRQVLVQHSVDLVDTLEKLNFHHEPQRSAAASTLPSRHSSPRSVKKTAAKGKQVSASPTHLSPHLKPHSILDGDSPTRSRMRTARHMAQVTEKLLMKHHM